MDKKNIKDIYGLTTIQEGMLYHNLIDRNIGEHFLQFSFEIAGGYDEELLKSSLHAIMQKHEILKSNILTTKKTGKSWVVVPNKTDITFEVVEILDDCDTAKEIDFIKEKDRLRGFNFEKDNLIRLTLIKINNEKSILIWSMHHVIVDGWSIPLMFADFIKYYNYLDTKTPEQLLEDIEMEKSLIPSYKEYIAWYNKQDKEKGVEYWENILSGYEQKTSIQPLIKSKLESEKNIVDQKRHTINIDIETKEKISRLCIENSATENTFLEACWAIVLQRYNNAEDVVFGKVVSGRNVDIRNIEQTVGLFINTIPVKANFSGSKSFLNILNELQNQYIEGSNYHYCSAIDIKERIKFSDELFDNLFVFENYHIDQNAGKDMGKLNISMIDGSEKSIYPLAIIIDDKTLSINFQHNTSIYSDYDMKLLADRFNKVISFAVENPCEKIDSLDILSEEESNKILYQFNNTKKELNNILTISQMFEEQVEIRKNATALVFGDENISYEELNKKANMLANTLKQKGVGKESVVGLFLERSIEMFISIFAVLKAGGAYLAISRDTPEERIEYILTNADVKIVLTDTDFEFNAISLNILNSENYSQNTSNLESITNENSLAYVIYTSGTTGVPKGVEVEHIGVYNLRNLFIDDFSITCDDKTLQFANYSFDGFVWEMTESLLMGGELHIINEAQKSDAEFLEEYIKNNITCANLPPVLANQIKFNGLKLLLTAGSEFNRDVIKNCSNVGCIVNAYGPTETTVNATFYKVDRRNVTRKIPIGKPQTNSQIYILNNGKNCGIGIVGEICVCGVSLARGYRNNEELTLEKFTKNPFGEGRMYRTGDLGRWLEDGNIEYLGRIDEQVKIRGFRIELLDVEIALRSLEYIEDVVVIAKEVNGDKALCAYFVGDDIENNSISYDLKKKLPNYMIPQYIKRIDKIQTNKNGKVDKNKLPEIVFLRTNEYIAPRNEIEKNISDVFKEVLSINEVGIDDNFFNLGGHSLRATKAINRIEAVTGKRLDVKDIFEHPTPRLIAKLVDSNNDYKKIEKADEAIAYKMSSVQKRMYNIFEMNRDTTAYNMPSVAEVYGEISLEKVQKSFDTIVSRHESFRTVFTYEDGEYLQIIKQIKSFKVEYQKFEDKNIDEIIKAFIRPFDINYGPLVRISICEIKDKKYLLVDMHHIISDGMSMGIFMSEFSRLYRGETIGQIDLQYKDYSEYINKKDLSKQEEYWLGELESTPVLEMPYDYARPIVKSQEGAVIDGVISRGVTEKLNVLVQKTKATDYMVLLSTFMLLLKKYSGQDDICIGTPVSGRISQQLENVIGMFVNTLVIRGKLNSDKAIKEFISEIKETTIKAYENQEYPYEELVEKCGVERDLSRNPLFDAMFILQNNEDVILDVEGTSFKPLNFDSNTSKFDISITAFKVDGEYKLKLEYSTELFKPKTAHLFLKRYIKAIESIVENIDVNIGELNILGEAEKKAVLSNFSQSMTMEYKPITIHEAFEKQVEIHKDKIALVFGEEKLTYNELNKMANQLARKIKKLGVDREDVVAMHLSRSNRMIISMLAILKAGACYLPISKDMPKDRIDYILSNSGAKILICDDNHIDIEGEDSSNLEIINTPNDLAYIIYTSGTTGVPKGVEVEHIGIANLANFYKERFNINEDDHSLQFANYAFDASVEEIYRALLLGGTLHIVEDINDIHFIEKYINEKITVATIPPIYASQMKISNLKLLMTAGSDFNKKVIDNICNVDYLINIYGPTEASVSATYYVVSKEEEKIPIGRPINNTSIYILNDGNICGTQMIGEIYIGGVGVARGYRNNNKLTNDKFIRNSFAEGKLYKTGDLGRWLEDGNIEYLGRIDEQVKIRGFRVEIGDIESTTRQIKDIKDVVVIAKNIDGQKKLCMYYLYYNKVSVNTIREELVKKLPHYMIPQYIMELENFPVTRNGKLDKKMLPDIYVKSENEFVIPKNEVEKILVDAFAQVLEIDRVSTLDQFLELGGDSIKAIRIISKLKEKGYAIDIKYLLQGMNIKMIAKNTLLYSGRKYEQGDILGQANLTPIQHRFFNQKLVNNNHFNQSVMFEFDKGFITSDEVNRILKKLTSHHDILRAVYKDGAMLFNQSELEFITYDIADIKVGVEDTLFTYNNELQKSFDISNGPLIKAAFYSCYDKDYVIIVVHHLAIDGVSWQIISEDIEKLIGQIKKNESLELGKKTASYLDWSNYLIDNKSIVLRELDYWDEICKKTNKLDIIKFNNNEEGYKTANLAVSDVEFLLSNKIINAKANQLLLAAVSKGYKTWAKQDEVAIDIEGHGRESFSDLIYIDRTIGWFTSIYPIVLKAYDNIEKTIINAKEAINSVPNNGIGFGIIKYLEGKEYLNENVDICFNYLGEVYREKSNIEFKPSNMPKGHNIDTNNEYEHKIIINASVFNGNLNIEMAYDSRVYSESEINQFIYSINLALEEIKEYSKKPSDIKTASDFNSHGLKQSDIEYIGKEVNEIEEIYPLTVIQQGMIYYNTIDNTNGNNFLQFEFSLNGKINIENIENAFNILALKYNILKAKIITIKNSGDNFIIIPKERKLDFKYLDISDLSNKDEFIEDIKNNDILSGFNFEKDSLMRGILIKKSDNEASFIWSMHHIIIDGWCTSILFKDFILNYRSINDGQKDKIIDMIEIANTLKYKEYIEWYYKQDHKTSTLYWENLLSEYDTLSEIQPMEYGLLGESNDIINPEVKIQIKGDIKDDIINLCKKINITESTFFEVALGILVQKYQNTDDVVFGKVVSGRNADVRNIDTAVGLFINTIPTRITSEKKMTVKDLLLSTQNQFIEGSKYHFTSLKEIQEKTILKNNLFNILFVFENYFVQKDVTDNFNDFNIEVKTATEKTTFPITVNISSSEMIDIKLQYDSGIYKEIEINLLAKRLYNVITKIVSDENAEISSVEICDSESEKAIEGFNETFKEYNNNRTLVEIFEDTVKKHPDNIAVEHKDESITYREL
ncbi:MAG: amino acid adenylation domain-containing protein, partial [Oscillospiraceae bacterium]